MNKNKQVGHSKQETIGVFFKHPSPKSLCSPKYSVTHLTKLEIPKIIVVTSRNAVNNKQYISEFWFLKLAK